MTTQNTTNKQLKNKTIEELIKEIIDLGYEIEAQDYNASRFAGYGFTRKNISNLRSQARNRIIELNKRNIDVFNFDFKDIEHEYSLYDEEDLDYALQFI